MDEDISGEVIVDASFILAFLLPDERADEVDKIFDLYEAGTINFISTQLLPFEVLNSLRNSILRKRITKSQANDLAIEFFKIKIILEEVGFRHAFSLSLAQDLSFYDASYIWLARSKNFPLLTLDVQLRRILRKHDQN